LELDAKRLEILKSAVPGASRIALLATSRDPASRDRIAATERAARSLGIQMQIIEASGPGQPAAAFDTGVRSRADALMVLGSANFFHEQARMAELARAARMPMISAWREFADAGGLMSYGANVPAMFRRAAGHVDRILKGANAGNLPVEQANTFELLINLKTAKALGLTIPPSLLARADQVIE
jgi:putative ABC transport system substrate-binding protein